MIRITVERHQDSGSTAVSRKEIRSNGTCVSLLYLLVLGVVGGK